MSVGLRTARVTRQFRCEMIDLLTLNDFFDAATRSDIVEKLKDLGGGLAPVYGRADTGAVDVRVRKVTRLAVSPELRNGIRQRLLAGKEAIEAHFGVRLNECEEPQFLRYEEGDYFVPHQDGNTPLILDDSRHRKISVVIFLNAQSPEPTPDTYGGGELVFHGPFHGPTIRQPLAPEPGTLIAFRAEVTHEVVPVTHGERYTIVSWFR